jgi:hypothetical protein
MGMVKGFRKGVFKSISRAAGIIGALLVLTAMPQIPALGETSTPTELTAVTAQNAKTPYVAPVPAAGISAPGYLKWVLLLLFLVLAGLRGGFVFTYFKRRPLVAAAMDEEPVEETFFHRCAHCGKTELTAPDMEFRVARNGEEYCHPHLPKAV